MTILSMVPLETTESSAGAWPYIIGGGILLIFLFLLFCMLAFGKGRDHS
jgi:hypothetical protein